MRIILTYLIIFPLQAEIIKDVVVIGNTKTNLNAILKHAQISIGKDISINELEKINSNLRKINQIIIKNLQLKNGILTITVEEKWTLFPIPMITQSGKYYNRGILVYEDNFLGALGTFASGLSWSQNQLNAILYFQDENLFNPNWGLKILALKKNEFIEFKRGSTIKDTHESNYKSILLTPNFLYKDHVFKIGPLITTKQIKDGLGQLVAKDYSTGLFFRHHLNAYQVVDVRTIGLITTYDFYLIRSEKNHWFFRHEIEAKWSLSAKENLIDIGIHALTVNDQSFLYSKTLGGEEGFRGHDKFSLPSKNNAGLTFQYQQKLFDSIYLSPFYEFNKTHIIQSAGGDTLTDSTLGLGIRYYFKKISIPAIQFDTSFNTGDKSTHILLNIGASL